MLQGGSILRSLTKQEKVFGLLSNSGLMPCFQVTFLTPVKQAVFFPKFVGVCVCMRTHLISIQK